MNIFDILSEIGVKKTGTYLDDSENETDFAPYLIQRWFSMYSAGYANLLNISTNVYWKVLQSKPEWYKLFLVLIPSKSTNKIYYIKKVKKEKDSDSDEAEVSTVKKKKKIDKDHVRFLAEHFELSQREILEYLEQDEYTNAKLVKVIGE